MNEKRNERRLVSVLSFLVMAWLGTLGALAQPAPLGPETRVDTPDGDQLANCPVLGVRPMGAFEIAWDYGGSVRTDVAARGYAASGVPVSPQILVGDEGYYPLVNAVTPLSYGFRVLFRVVDDLGEEPTRFYRRRVQPQGGEPRQVGTSGTRWVWPGPGETLLAGTYQTATKRLIAQKVAPNGQPEGFQYVLSSRPIIPFHPAIVPLDDRRFVAVFSGTTVASGATPARQVLRARRFSISGPLGPDFEVNTVPGGTIVDFIPRPPLLGDFVAASDRFGRFAVAWTVSDSSGITIRLRVFNSAGVPMGPEAVAMRPTDFRRLVSMAFNDSGQVLLLWHRTRLDPFRHDLQARVFDSRGTPAGPVFSPHSAASGVFEWPVCGSVGWAKDAWIITWAAQKAESEFSAIFVRRFAD